MTDCVSEKDICRLAYKTGSCKASIPRWYYDFNEGTCKRFSYGGCDGNENNFESLESCESSCSRQRKPIYIVMIVSESELKKA